MIVDPHEIVNVSGIRGLQYMLDATADIPVHAFVQIPSSVPASDSDINGAGQFLAADMQPFMNHPRILGLGELMRFTDVVNGESRMLDKLNLFDAYCNDGHAPGITGTDVQAYRFAGAYNDHESETYQEALEKLRAGIMILIREGSGARNLESIVRGMVENGLSTEYCGFCTDDKHLEDIKNEGHIDHCVRKAIALGMNPIQAIKIATWNTARAIHRKDLGAIAPSYKADLLILSDLKSVSIETVIVSGHVVDEAYLRRFKNTDPPKDLLHTIVVPNVSEKDMALKVSDRTVVMELVPDSLLTKKAVEKVPHAQGYFVPDSVYSKLCVVERYGKTGRIKTCVLKGYGIQNGAIATSISHDAHNIIAAGDNDKDMIAAIKHLEYMQGGLVICSKGEILEELPLPIGGLMSDQSEKYVETKIQHMMALAKEHHISASIDPLITLSFLALTVIPEIRLCEAGLFDVKMQGFIL